MLSPLPNESWFRSLSCILSLCFLFGTHARSAQPTPDNGGAEKNGETGKAPSALPIPTYTLRDCLRIAHEKQPKLVAVRASLASAEAGQRGLEDTRIIGCLLIPDIKYRRQQASQGILAGQAELHQAEKEVIQAVVWNYYSIIYAREQQKTVRELTDLIQTYRDQVDKIVNSKEGGNRDINQNTLDTLNTSLFQAKRRALATSSGIERAKAALQEAMGLPSDQDFTIPEDTLPAFETKLDLDVLIRHATTLRGEVMLAGVASEVSRLEVFAQWSIRFRLRTNTYTLTSDIHHTLIPGGSKDDEYRPDAIAPEMPPHLVGKRENRTAKVQALSERADAILEKTRNLVTLETKSAYIKWDYANRAANLAKDEMKATRDLLSRLRKVADEEGFKGVTIENVIRAQAAYTEALAASNEARYQQIVNLAALERITGGGITVNYPGR